MWRTTEMSWLMNRVGDAHLVLEIAHQVQHLRLDGDVERGDGFVGGDHGGAQHQRAGDGDPLALPAGELMGIAVERLSAEANPIEHLAGVADAVGAGRRGG